LLNHTTTATSLRRQFSIHCKNRWWHPGATRHPHGA